MERRKFPVDPFALETWRVHAPDPPEGTAHVVSPI